jgi:serine phosphatase RsbU (regulator of sigma subunit)
MAFILIPYARKLLAEDQKQKELALHQTLELAQKNKDIMASIRYALKIQTAIFPSDETFRKNEREIFVYHSPKDVVAGDFYWIERRENFLFFAVADCTGHGVPGAILSIVCINALNNAVELCASDETGVILDTTRRLIAKQIGTDENQMRDGMDIALCRLNLDTNELSYSGAFNPIYIFEKNPQKMTVLTPDKQPVGNYVRQVPFTSKSHQLQPGDLVYLFTDGYADQFGGEFGKKYNYKSFQKLLESLSNLSMNEQKKELRKAFIEWMKDHEQLDDVCVMGVKI